MNRGDVARWMLALRTTAAHGDRVDRIVEFGYVVAAPVSHVPASMRIATLATARIAGFFRS